MPLSRWYYLDLGELNFIGEMKEIAGSLHRTIGGAITVAPPMMNAD
jgi:hypothetical protein